MNPAALSPMVRDHLVRAYPRNHSYFLLGKRMVPSFRLWRRYRRIRALYPENPASLVDLSASKGWFCLHAAQRLGASRVLGIDLHDPDLEACREVRDYLGLGAVDFQNMRLHQLHSSLEEHGGAFDVSLVINLYHYLYFGSHRAPEHYGSHAEIFEHLRAITGGALILSNCTEIEQLPGHMQVMAREQGRAESFTGREIWNAASEFFHVTDHGRLGKRPLWRLTPR
jgi:hypothetical protein